MRPSFLALSSFCLLACTAVFATNQENKTEPSEPLSIEDKIRESSHPDKLSEREKTKSAPKTLKPTEQTRPRSVHYVPPQLGMPKARVTMASRTGNTSQEDGLQTGSDFSVIAPDHLGFSLSSQPTLYWYQSQATTKLMEFVLTERSQIKPLLRLRMDNGQSEGLHPVDLAQHGVQLEPEKVYRWSIAWVKDEASRSTDWVSSGYIQFKDGKMDLLAQCLQESDYQTLAEHGYFYDAWHCLQQRLKQDETEELYLKERKAFLNQIGLALSL